ncbi:MAG TPA: hypothetical protein H9830_00795, partial [Candidatus Agrococcus pullicola]|nr:hypothetical protein [Candidatus Agrococcus pullicola]
IDMVERDGFTLFVSESAAKTWEDAVHDVTCALPLHIVAISDDERDWAASRGIGSAGALLVRPDWIVAWRVVDLPPSPSGALQRAVDTVLRGGEASLTDPAEPFVERIRVAAEGIVGLEIHK